MMESIRTGVQKPWIKFLLAVVVVSFVFAGYFTSQGGADSADAIAKVNDEEITARQWNTAVNSEASRYGEQFNAMFPTEERKEQFRLNVLDKLINSELVAQEVSELGFRASAKQIQEQVIDIPQLQIDGKFSTAMLDQLLVNRGWSRNYFQQLIAEDITQSQFLHIFTATQVAMPYEVEKRIALEQQQRSVKALVVKFEPFEEQVTVTEEELRSYYDNNLDSYKVSEKLVVKYIELKTDDLMSSIEVADEQVEEYYQANQDLYRAEEERRVAHILIKTEERSEDEARAKIEALAQRIEAGDDFAEVAKAESEDFSAEQGGDLGFAGRGVMDAEFEKAMFALDNVGDVSEPVESNFGFHLIKLLEVKDGDVRPLADVKDEIVTRLKSEEAEKQFYIKKDKIKQLAFEKYQSLSPAAAEAGLEIKTSEPFAPTGGEGVFANMDVVNEAYSQSVLGDARNSKVVDVSEDHIVVMRKENHIQARTKPLDEVKGEVTTAVRLKKAREMAQEKGQVIVDKLNRGESVESEVSELGLEWKTAEKIRRNSSELGFDLTRLAFQAPKPVDGVAQAMGNELLNGDFAVVQVTEVITPDVSKLTEAEKKQAQSRIIRSMQDSSYQSFVEASKKDADVVKYQERIQQQP